MASNSADGDEVVRIFYSVDDGNEWASYLNGKLTEKHKLVCELKEIETYDILVPSTASVNVVLVTPVILDDGYLKVTRGLQNLRCILVLTGIKHKEYVRSLETLKLKHVLDWHVHEIDGSEDSVRELILFIISLYESSMYSTLPAPRQVNAVIASYIKVTISKVKSSQAYCVKVTIN